MPLGFSYNFTTLSSIDLAAQPPMVSNLFSSVFEAQARIDKQTKYEFVCEVFVQLKSVKKVDPDSTHLKASVGSEAAEGKTIVLKPQRLIDKYPLSYKEIVQRILKECSDKKLHEIVKVIRDFKVKENPALSAFNFRTRLQEEKFKKTGVLPTGIASIYNMDAVQFIIGQLKGQK